MHAFEPIPACLRSRTDRVVARTRRSDIELQYEAQSVGTAIIDDPGNDGLGFLVRPMVTMGGVVAGGEGSELFNRYFHENSWLLTASHSVGLAF